MGEEAAPQEGDKFVANASEGDAAPAPEETPAEGETPAGKEPGELSGDENADEVEQFLRKKYGEKLRPNDLQQMLRWRKQATEAGKAGGRLKELEESSKKGIPSDQALRSLASTLGAGHLEKLQELGPEEFIEFITATGKHGKHSQASSLGLDPNDPKDQMLQQLLDWKTKTEQGQAQDAERSAMKEQSTRFAENLTAAVEKLDLKSDPAKMIAWRLTDSLYAQAGHVPGDPDSPEVGPFAKQAKELLETYAAVVSGKEEEETIQATPTIPAFTKTKEPPGREREDEDEDDAEERGFIERAGAGKGG